MEILNRNIYITVLAVSLLMTVALSVIVNRRREFPGRRPFVAMVITVSVLLIITILQTLVRDEESLLRWARAALIPGSFIAPFWCMFAIRFARADRPLPASLVLLMMFIPAAVTASVLLNAPPGAVFAHAWLVDTPIGAMMEYLAGPLFWVNTYYAYSVFFVGTIVFIRTAFRVHRVYLRQGITLTVAALIPFLTDLVFVFNIGGLPRVNLLPVALGLSTMIIALTIGRLGFFHVLPVAHGLLFRNLTDGAVVIDFEGRVVDANQSAHALLGMTRGSKGSPARDLLKAVPDVERFLDAPERIQEEIELRSAEPIWVSLASVPLAGRRGKPVGRLITVHDITHRKLVQQEQERLLAELQDALNNVRTLQHLLPICANCKKIRDDKGYWTQVEAYVMEHTDARFSHGVCPECFKLLAPGEQYPEPPSES
ncbi:MAG: PAS domain-containing protein [Bacteroidetes bacterium]|nr:PAS domain-containing protein [Bacteroidota bacterium]